MSLEWDEIKWWHYYLYYNVFFIITIISSLIEKWYELRHLTDVIVSFMAIATFVGSYLFYHPKRAVWHENTINQDLKSFFLILGKVWAIGTLTAFQILLIFYGLLKLIGKPFVNFIKGNF